jgi:sterol 3beta-glucosyltransferase
MKIALSTHGTRGDVQPFVSLALALMERGHDVTLGAPVNLVGFGEKCGVRTRKIAIDTQAFLESEQGRAWLSSGDVGKFMKELGAINRKHRDELMDDFLAVCADADVLVTGVLTEDFVSTIAEARGLPMLSVHFNPMRANEAYPNALVTTRSLPGFLNHFTGTLAEKVWWSAYSDDVNAFRQKLGLTKTSTPTPRRMLERQWPTLQAFSSTIAPTPKRYGEAMPVLGSIRFPDAARAKLGESVRDPGLAAWLDAGTPPVFFGLGSMPVKDPAAMLKTVESVTKACGVRAVIGAGWSKLEAAAGLSPDVRIVGAVDHGWLLPKCRASVHHGGAGTAVAALSAGLPAVVASVFADQPFWGMRLEQLGAGVHLPFKRLHAVTLEKALRRVLRPEVAATAQRLGQSVQAEPDGTAAIVARIERSASA